MSANICSVRQHHVLRLPGSLGHSNRMEMGLLHSLRWWIRTQRSLHGVSDLVLWAYYAVSNHFSCHSWAHEICSGDNEERALVIGSMNEMAYVFQAWLPLIIWLQVDAPQYRKGFIGTTILSVILIITTWVIRSLQHREDAEKEWVVSFTLTVHF